MDVNVEFERREPVATVALASPLNLKDVSLTMERLRSWAGVRSVAVAGTAFLRVTGDAECSVHLPLVSATEPHPETRIEAVDVPAADLAIVRDIRFGGIVPLRDALLAALAESPAAAAEFHSVNGDFFAGDLALVLTKAAPATPVTLSIDDSGAGQVGGEALERVRIVTVARQHGTGGEVVAEAVAGQLGMRLIDYEVFRRAAEQSGLSADTLKDVTVHKGRFSRLLDQLARTAGTNPEGWMTPVSLRTEPIFTSIDYREFVEDAIRDLAEQGDVVIMGHGAQLLLADRPDTFRVLITGGEAARVARAKAGGLSEEEALRSIREADQERLDYFREFYREGWLDPASYDLVVNTDRISVEDATALVLDAVRRRDSLGVPRSA